MSDQWPGSRQPGNDERPAKFSPAMRWRPGPGRPQRWIRPAILIVVGVVAALAGAGIVLAAHDLSGQSGNAAAVGSRPSYLAPGPPRDGQPMPPGGGTGPSAEIFLIGQVTAASSTSITIGAPARSITAAITADTQITGKVSSISGINVGDRVSAQITQRAGRYTATAIQDPPRSPSGITAP